MNYPLHPSERVLVRLPNWLGDVVMAEPAVHALVDWARKNGSSKRLTLAGPARYVDLLGANVPSLPTQQGRLAARDLRGFDVALLLTGSFRSAWTAWRAGIPVRLGQARDGRGPLLSHAVRPAFERGRVPFGLGRSGRRPRVLPRPFGLVATELVHLLGVPVGRRTPRLAAPNVDPPFEGAPFFAVNVGARPGSAKGWPAERWSTAINELAQTTGWAASLMHGPGEAEAARAVVAGLNAGVRSESREPALDELAGLFRAAELVLTADVGPRHLAQAVGTPTVVVMGPTDPRHTDLYGADVRVLRRSVPCGPCHAETCPLPANAEPLACMLAVEPDDVVRAACELLP